MNEVTPIHATSKNKNRHRHFLLLLIPSLVFSLTLFLFVKGKWNNPHGETLMSQTSREIKTIKVGDVSIDAVISRSDVEQERGLSGVSDLGEKEGMLFVFDGETRPSFWMKDMLIPLDFIWIHDGKVSQIHKNVKAPAPGTSEQDLELLVPDDPVNYVLEVNAGFTDKFSVKVGDDVNLGSL